MADPVTLAVVGATAGAALNPDDPLKGALIGGTVGFGGAQLAGLGATAAVPAGTTVGAAGVGGAAGGTGLTAATTASPVAGSALGAAGAGQTGLTAMANPAMTAAAPLSTAAAPGLSALANPSMSLAAPVGMSTATPTMIQSGQAMFGKPTMAEMAVASQLMARGQPQQQSEVRQGGMMRPGQAVNVMEPVASLLEPLKNRRPRPAFSLL